jgi:hypothetical protein
MRTAVVLAALLLSSCAAREARIAPALSAQGCPGEVRRLGEVLKWGNDNQSRIVTPTVVMVEGNCCTCPCPCPDGA